MIWFILFIIVIIVGCFIVYREAEVHELHKMRAGFENRKHQIEEHILLGTQGKSVEELETDEEKGELEELKEVIEMIDEEIERVKLI